MDKSGLLIPVKQCRRLGGRFTFGRSADLVGSDDSDRVALGQLRADLEKLHTAARVRIVPGWGGDVTVRRSGEIATDEGYEMTIRPGGVEIRARADAGAYYAVQTLRDLLATCGQSLPAMRIRDWPDLPRRGIYHDCSRGKVPKVKTVCALIERLGRWKINELQLYIENTFRYRRHPAIGAGYSPFTAADILRIQEHGRKHHVRLVGSLASFGHLEKVLSLPEYRHLGELSDLAPSHPRGDLCPTDPRSIRFLGELYDEFLPLLEARDFNACCDETSQIGTGRSRRRAEKIGIGRLYLEFVLKVRRLCHRHGKRLNIWGDIVLAHPEIIPDVPKDIVMLNWDYSPTGGRIDRTSEFAQADLPLVCCPGTNSWHSHGTRMKQANENIAKFARIARECGAEGLLNTDWGDHGHRNPLGASLHAFAFGGAHAWGGGQVDEKHFTQRFAMLTFGDRGGKLASALRALGAWCGGELYHGLVEPFDPEGAMKGYRTIDAPRLKAPDLRRRLERMRALRIPALKPPDEFDRLALAEFDLARRMDLLACRRILTGRELHAGKAVPARTLRNLARDMQALAGDFAALWRARSKPSRLRDNLKAFRRVAAEAEKLAGR